MLGPAGRQHAPGRPYRCPPVQSQGRHPPVLLRSGPAHPSRQDPTPRASRCSSAPKSTGMPGLEADLEILLLALDGLRAAAQVEASRSWIIADARHRATPCSTTRLLHRCVRCRCGFISALAAQRPAASCASAQRRDFPASRRAKVCVALPCRCMVMPRFWTSARALLSCPTCPASRHRTWTSLQWLGRSSGLPCPPVSIWLICAVMRTTVARGFPYLRRGRGRCAGARRGRYDEVGAVIRAQSPGRVGFSLDAKALVQPRSAPRALHAAIRAPWSEAGGSCASAVAGLAHQRATPWCVCFQGTKVKLMSSSVIASCYKLRGNGW
jgi:ATP phosphoribosyltransferase regulatory subunit